MRRTLQCGFYLRFYFALMLGVSAEVQATQEFCVNTVSEFNDAYETADEENVIIRVVQGTYDMTNSCIDNTTLCGIDDDVSIIGGYNSGCTARSGNATLTVFTRPGGGLQFETRGSTFSGNGDLSLRGMTFRSIPNGVRMTTENEGNPDASVRINQVWFDRTVASIAQSAEVFIRNSMVTGVTDLCALKIEANDSDGSFLELAQLTHVTVANNAGTGICVGNTQDSERYTFQMTNSIVWGNGTDIALEVDPGVSAIDADFLSNTFATLTNSQPLAGENIGTLSANPQFVNPGADDFELGGTSTSINSGFPLGSVESDKDLKGDNRRFSNAADRGALESAIGSTATTLTVTSTADSGLGTLRQAMLDANQSANLNRIHFDVGNSCGPRVFNLLSALPSVITPMVIDGYTQPGAVRNTAATGYNGTRCIVLRQPAGSFANSGLVVPGGVPDEVNLRVDGLGFSNFLIAGVQLTGGNGHAVVGSQFGGAIASVDLLPSGYGVFVGSAMRTLAIGGPESGERNVFGEANTAAIALIGSGVDQPSDMVVENNYIGLEPNGLTALPNAKGIVLRGAGNRIAGNTISSNLGVGVELDSATAIGNIVENNAIGVTAAFCLFSCERGNGSHGVLISDGASGNIVRNNNIRNNDQDGIAVQSAASNPIYGNSMLNNSGEGIDLGSSGRTPNDNDSAAPPSNAGNRNQNFPAITMATGGDGIALLSGTLSSVNAWYRIEFYADDDCPSPLSADTRQGRFVLSSTTLQISNATAGNDGSANFANVQVRRIGDTNFFAQLRGIIATATRYSANPLAGGRRLHTSEFSNCRDYVNNDEIFINGFE